jgi:uncharacterized protein YjdB
MAKKLILLILVLPLILMVCIYTAVNTVSLTVNVPVSKIEIMGEKIVYLDLDKNEKYLVNYAVYPTTANNKDVTFTTEAVGESRKAELEYKDGYILPKSVGTAKVYLTTVDGGFKDSMIVQVDATSIQAISCNVEKGELFIGETASITTQFVPINAPNKQLKYQVIEGADIVSVNAQGVVTGVSVGKATIQVSSLVNEEIFDRIEITVKSKTAMEFTRKETTLTLLETGGTVPLYIDTSAQVNYSIQALDENGNSADSIIRLEIEKTNNRLTYEFIDQAFVGAITVNLTVTQDGATPYTDRCIIVRIAEFEVAWTETESDPFVVLGDSDEETKSFYFTLNPANAEIAYSVALSNDYITATVKDGYLEVTAVKAAEDAKNSHTDVTLTIWQEIAPENKKTLTLRVYVIAL